MQPNSPKETLQNVLHRELRLSEGMSRAIADACSPEQLEGCIEFLQSRIKCKGRIDNWDKYALMMSNYFNLQDEVRQPHKKPKSLKSKAELARVKAFLNSK